MAESKLLQLAYELEWLGVELEYVGQQHAHQGFPNSGEAWTTFLEKQRGVLTTADKILRELKAAVSFNPTLLVGVEFPLEETLDNLTELIAAVEDIKETAVGAVHNLPTKVRGFTRMVHNYLGSVSVGRE
jgi:hypothetical protein